MSSQHKFDVQMLDFSAQNLPAKDRNGSSDPYLKLDFDNFKLFKTDTETRNLNPNWGFQKRFTYRTKFLERLNRKKFRIKCFDHNPSGAADFIGEASVDLLTLSTGPRHYTIALRDGHTLAGTVSFTCIMKMLSDVSLNLLRISVTLGGSPAPCRLQVFPSFNETQQILFPFAQNGRFEDPKTLTFETSLWDMLGPEENEHLRVQVLDNSSGLMGEGVVPFFDNFSSCEGLTIPLCAPVRLSGQVVGEVCGTIEYDNLPKYAQMAGGIFSHEKVQGGCLLCPGLPYPPGCTEEPPVLRVDSQFQSAAHPTAAAIAGAPTTEPDLSAQFPPPLAAAVYPDLSSPTANQCYPSPVSDSVPACVIEVASDQAKQQWDTMDTVDLPPSWEMRKDRRTGRPYFADHRSKKTCWTDPRFLPDNWEQRSDPSTGRVYYAYHKTRKTTFLDPRGMPHGWEMRLDDQGEPYFAYHSTRQTTFVDPRGLEDGFTAAIDDQGRLYYKNHHKKTTQWEDPRARDPSRGTRLAEARQEWWDEQKMKEHQIHCDEAMALDAES